MRDDGGIRGDMAYERAKAVAAVSLSAPNANSVQEVRVCMHVYIYLSMYSCLSTQVYVCIHAWHACLGIHVGWFARL